MAITWVDWSGIVSNGTGQPSSHTVAMPTGTQVGDLVVMAIGGRWWTATGGSTVTISTTGWSLLGAEQWWTANGTTTNRSRLDVHAKVATSGDLATGVTVGWSTAHRTNTGCTQSVLIGAWNGQGAFAGTPASDSGDAAVSAWTLTAPSAGAPPGSVNVAVGAKSAGATGFADNGFNQRALVGRTTLWSHGMWDDNGATPTGNPSETTSSGKAFVSFALATTPPRRGFFVGIPFTPG